MSSLRKQEKDSELQMQLSGNGLLKASSSTSELKMMGIGSMTSTVSLKKEKKKPKPKKSMSTVESQATLKKKTSNDKSNSSKKNTRNTKSSKTSAAESISKEKDSTKSWLELSKGLSRKSWLPTETGYVGSHGITSNGCLNSTELISSSKINRSIALNPSSAMTCSLSSTFSPHDTTVSGGNILLEKLKKTKMIKSKKQENMLYARMSKKDESRVKKEIIEEDVSKYIISSKCIKVSPINNYSTKTVNDAIAVHRKIWNSCVNEIQKNPKATKEELRDKFVTKKNMSKNNIKELGWTFRIAQKVREAVTSKFSANYETAKKNFENYKRKYYYKIKKKKNKKVKKKIKKKIVMQFKDRKDEKQTIYLNKEICEFRICPKTNKTILKTFNGVELVLHERYENFDTSSKCDRCQKVFTADYYKKHIKNKNACEKSFTKIKSGIPQAELILQRIGYEYFLYVPEYKNDKEHKIQASDRIVSIDPGWNTLLTYYSPDGEWGEICPGINDEIQKHRDKIEKLKSKPNIKPKAIQKRVIRITNKINDLHWKLCHWLLSKFRKIIIPRLYVARCNKKGKQTQADLRLCTFVDRLVHKSIEYKGSEVHIGKEHHTSQACTKCLSRKTKKADTVKCYDCNHEIHRDLNGARNIFLKHCY